MAHINNAGYAVVTTDPNTITELQSNHKIRLAVSEDGSQVWKFIDSNSPGNKWIEINNPVVLHEAYTEQGLRVNSDVVGIVGDFDDSGNGTKLEVDDNAKKITLEAKQIDLGGGGSFSFNNTIEQRQTEDVNVGGLLVNRYHRLSRIANPTGSGDYYGSIENVNYESDDNNGDVIGKLIQTRKRNGSSNVGSINGLTTFTQITEGVGDELVGLDIRNQITNTGSVINDHQGIRSFLQHNSGNTNQVAGNTNFVRLEGTNNVNVNLTLRANSSEIRVDNPNLVANAVQGNHPTIDLRQGNVNLVNSMYYDVDVVEANLGNTLEVNGDFNVVQFDSGDFKTLKTHVEAKGNKLRNIYAPNNWESDFNGFINYNPNVTTYDNASVKALVNIEYLNQELGNLTNPNGIFDTNNEGLTIGVNEAVNSTALKFIDPNYNTNYLQFHTDSDNPLTDIAGDDFFQGISISEQQIGVDANIGIGGQNGDALIVKTSNALEVKGDSLVLEVGNTTGTTGQVLTSDGQEATWQDAPEHEGYNETGTRAGSDISVTLGDYDNSGNFTFLNVDDDSQSITASAGGSTASLLISNSGSEITNGEGCSVELDSNEVRITASTTPSIKVKGTGVLNLMQGFTVATLPVGEIGDIAYITDGLSVSSNKAVTGGGTGVSLVFFNGTDWVYS